MEAVQEWHDAGRRGHTTEKAGAAAMSHSNMMRVVLSRILLL
jgi:hypothetical protein